MVAHCQALLPHLDWGAAPSHQDVHASMLSTRAAGPDLLQQLLWSLGLCPLEAKPTENQQQPDEPSQLLQRLQPPPQSGLQAVACLCQ